MDVQIKDGDIAVTPSGGCVYIEGGEELCQRVRLAVLTEKGAFFYDRTLGTDYSGLDAGDELLTQQLDMRIKEACADIADTSVEVVAFDRVSKIVRLSVSGQHQEITTEVDLSGILQ